MKLIFILDTVKIGKYLKGCKISVYHMFLGTVY